MQHSSHWTVIHCYYSLWNKLPPFATAGDVFRETLLEQRAIRASYFQAITTIIINNGKRTEWSPIWSVIIWAINKIGRPHSGSPICLITGITNQIRRYEVLLPNSYATLNTIIIIFLFFHDSSFTYTAKDTTKLLIFSATSNWSDQVEGLWLQTSLLTYCF